MMNDDDDTATGNGEVFEKEEEEEEIEIDFRSLLSHSRYEQIERELMKMFEQRRRDYRGGSQCVHNHHHSLERHLLDIEEDLHKIMLLMVKQLEMLSGAGKLPPTNLNLSGEEKPPQNRPVVQSIPPMMTQNFREEHPPTTIPTGNDRSTSEYSRLCNESDERFRQNINKIQNQSGSRLLHSHYRLTKPDIDFILSSSGGPDSQSHSKTAWKQSQIAKLKQHGPLCSRIGEFRQRVLQKDGDHHGQTLPRQQILRQIQGLIEELHLEHDWISKKLHHYQKQNELILGENRVLSQLADRINYRNMTTLSEHLIHIMDHLYELHQLNKNHLKFIIGN